MQDKITVSAFNRIRDSWEELKKILPDGDWKAEKVPTVGDLPDTVPQREVWEIRKTQIVDSIYDCVHGPTAEFTADLFNLLDEIFNAVDPSPDVIVR